MLLDILGGSLFSNCFKNCESAAFFLPILIGFSESVNLWLHKNKNRSLSKAACVKIIILRFIP